MFGPGAATSSMEAAGGCLRPLGLAGQFLLSVRTSD